jgi:hypothetical protein
MAMNLQTSFLTPPFGFALFYLRSVAAKKDYKDRVTGETIPAVTHGADLQGLDRLHRAAGDHGGGGHRLPANGHRRHRQGRAGRRRQGAGDHGDRANEAPTPTRRMPAPAPALRRSEDGDGGEPAGRGKAAEDDPMKALLGCRKKDGAEEVTGPRSRLPRAAWPPKKRAPPRRGPFRWPAPLLNGRAGRPCDSQLLALHEVVEAGFGEAEPQVAVAAEGA